jgi:hypothetical protein
MRMLMVYDLGFNILADYFFLSSMLSQITLNYMQKYDSFGGFSGLERICIWKLLMRVLFLKSKAIELLGKPFVGHHAFPVRYIAVTV